MNKQKDKKKKEFSKILVAQESALIWIMTISFIILAFICVKNQYFNELPWLTAMVGFPWTAYGVSQAFYYNKAKRENEIKLKQLYGELAKNEPDYSTEPLSGQDGPIEG